jgi:hypothetical protein
LKEIENECLKVRIYAHIKGLKAAPDTEELVGKPCDVFQKPWGDLFRNGCGQKRLEGQGGGEGGEVVDSQFIEELGE